MVRDAGRAFKAVTWNVYHGTPVRQLVPILEKDIEDGTSIWLIQEADAELAKAMRDRNLRVYRRGQYLVAWSPRWTSRSRSRIDLATTAYYRPGGRVPVDTQGVAVVLVDRDGRSLEALSYHLPPSVQRRRPVVRRFRALKESMRTLGRRSRKMMRSGAVDAILYGGDDNVDETGAKLWDFMRRAATGLRQVKAPAPTHGHKTKGRRIDDFRVRGLKPGRGSVGPGGGDHRRHRRTFRWAR